MLLWSVVRQMGKRLDQEVDLMKMFELFPVKVESGDPLALELSLNINAAVKHFGLFPTIALDKHKDNFPLGRLD